MISQIDPIKHHVFMGDPNSTVSVSEVIIWASPLVGALALYLAHDVLTAIKDDIRLLKERTYAMREHQIEHGSKLDTLSTSVSKIDRVTEISSQLSDQINRKTVDQNEMLIHQKALDKKLNEHEANYGKVILILRKLISVLPKKTPPPQG